jgi:hypothetical protein
MLPTASCSPVGPCPLAQTCSQASASLTSALSRATHYMVATGKRYSVFIRSHPLEAALKGGFSGQDMSSCILPLDQ